MNLELTDNEAQTLTGLIDLAIKAGGLQVAEAGVVLASKIAQVAQAKPAPAPAPAPEGAAP